MSRTIVVLKDSNETRKVILELPDDLAVRQLVNDLREALELPFTNNQGQYLSYAIKRKKSGQTLAFEQSLSENGVYRGEVLLLLTHNVGPVRPKSTGDLSASVRVGALYTVEESRLLAQVEQDKASERWYDALQKLLNFWFAKHHSSETKVSPVIVSTLDEVLSNFLETELERGSPDTALKVLQHEKTLTLFEVSATIRSRQLQNLKRISRRMAGQSRYETAQEAAILALQIDETDVEANNLQVLGRDYQKWHTSRNPIERFELAQRIFNIDPEYGSIQRDLRLSEIRLRGGNTPD